MQRVLSPIFLSVALLAFAATAMAGGEKCHKAAEAKVAEAGAACAESAEACLSKMATKIRSKGWIGIETEKNADGRYEVASVEPGSPGEAAGFRAGDVLLALDELDLYASDREKLAEIKHNLTVGSRVRYTVATGGEKREIDVTLAEVPSRIMAQWIGQHMLDQHAHIEVAAR